MFHEGEIRLLDPEICTATEELSAGCQEFVEDVKQMNSTTDIFLNFFTVCAEQVDKMKLQALGMKNLINMEENSRATKEKELKAEISFVETEIDKLTKELDSLRQIEKQQEKQATLKLRI